MFLIEFLFTFRQSVVFDALLSQKEKVAKSFGKKAEVVDETDLTKQSQNKPKQVHPYLDMATVFFRMKLLPRLVFFRNLVSSFLSFRKPFYFRNLIYNSWKPFLI